MITPRLKCIINHVKTARIADIGTDHAYIPIYLAENNIVNYVIASDIRRGPAEIARNNIKKHNLSDKIEVRIGGGLSVLREGETEEIIIAGMGGELISRIIRDDIKISQNCGLILQPMNEQHTLRKFLIENGFKITDEDISAEGFKVYNIITARAGLQKPFKTEIEYHIPKYLKANKNFKKLYEKKHRELTKIITGMENSRKKDMEKLYKYKNLLKELESYES